MEVDILILGAGWTSTFLIPLCSENFLSYAATSRSGRDSTIKFEFDPHSADIEPYKHLPDAHTVLITFPIDQQGASERLVKCYTDSRQQQKFKTGFIQLGTTGMWDGRQIKKDAASLRQFKWYDRHSPYDATPRAEAEQEFLSLSPEYPTTVINLAGLWGGSRSTRNWVGKVAPTKEALRNKGSIHIIHGLDVSRAVLAVHTQFDKAQGQRWILTDGRVYDWWDLASAWGVAPAKQLEADTPMVSKLEHLRLEEGRGPHARWVRELMEEQSVRALPRNVELLGRALDSRDFWRTFGLSPAKARLEIENL